LNRHLTLSLFIFFCLLFQAKSQGIIEFVENKGQWDKKVKYRGMLNSGAFFIRDGGFTILQHNPNDILALSERLHGIQSANGQSRDGSVTVNSHSWNVDFIGASPQMRIAPDKQVSTNNNYFIGNDPSKWASDCRLFQAITLQDVYPNVDVRYYTDNSTLKYDIIVKPGANVSKIALRYTGIDKLDVKNKELVTSTSLGEMKESSPYTYQFKGGVKTEVACKYVVKDNVVKFDLRNYDPNTTVIIDPTLVFCSFSGSSTDNWGFTATYGPDGSFFGGGIAFESSTGSFPTSPGAYQTVFQGGDNADGAGAIDIALIKLAPDGRTRMYATYLGGSSNEQPHSLVVDGAGNLIVAGRSSSPNFPVTGGAAGNIGPTGSYDIIVTKLNAAGNNLIGSKRIGGSSDDGVNITTSRSGTNLLMRNYGDDGRSEVIIDGGGNIYVASSTRSSNFPASAGSFQPSFGGGSQDGVVLKFNSNVSSLLFASFLGGSGDDAGYVLSLAPNGNIFVGGGTTSNNLPGSSAGTVGPSNHGPAATTPIDGYLVVVSNDGSTPIRSTYLGTSGIDQVYGVQFDRFGFPYVMGQTTGAWPVLNAAFSNAGGKQFIAKLQPDLSAFVYSTVFGTGSATPNISPIAFLVDRCENVYVSGWGGHFFDNNNFNSAGTSGLPITPDAIKSTTDGRDFYFFVLERNATAQLFGSFWGENNNVQANPGSDHVDGGTSRFDQNGVIYQAICGNCRLGQNVLPYPTTPGAWSTTNNTSTTSGGGCNLTMVKIAMNLAGVGAQVQSAIDGVPRDTAGCVPLTVDFTDSVRNAVWYEWNFGDGTPTVGPLPAATGFTQSHTYNAIGTYQVMLIAIDSSTCNIRDTSYIHIRVGDLRASVAFQPVKLNPCDSFKYRFDNLSVAPPSKPFGPRSFVWDYGDGSPKDTTGSASVFHSYPAPGTYNVILQLIDTSYCNSPESDTIQLRVSAIVDAQFTTPPTGCAPYTATFNNTSVGGLTFQWFFGDGGTSTAINPTYTYNTAGSYDVVLIATDPNTCNVTDTARFTINVFDNPLASFSYTPIVPIENTAHTFTNQSSPDAVRFRWDFGDGDTLLTTSRSPVVHQYNTTGTFNACLRAYNAAGCFDDTCQQVTTLIVPLVDVPNAFTPQTGNQNSIVYVRGFGISKMRFIIWNRWGQKVFETDNRLQGWDGKYKGAVQPMDVYAYTLEVEFFDGTKTTKKGDITLIR
jgi:gliding motility-associated-like protein